MTKDKAVAIKLHNIGVDFEIYQLIESARQSFDEQPHDVLKRLLHLEQRHVDAKANEEIDAKREANIATAKARNYGRGKAWEREGVVIPHGSEARFTYQRGQQHKEGRFLDGDLVVDGKRYSTLSEAANDLATTRNGKRTRLNGWAYWEVKIVGDNTFRAMDDLRHGPSIKKPVVRVKAGSSAAAARSH
jgi:hypothetical protein